MNCFRFWRHRLAATRLRSLDLFFLAIISSCVTCFFFRPPLDFFFTTGISFAAITVVFRRSGSPSSTFVLFRAPPGAAAGWVTFVSFGLLSVLIGVGGLVIGVVSDGLSLLILERTELELELVLELVHNTVLLAGELQLKALELLELLLNPLLATFIFD